MKAYTPLIIGMFLIVISTVGPLSKGYKIVHDIKNIKGDEVRSILLQPTEINGIKSIVNRDIYITDTRLIHQLCTALSKAQIAEEGFLKNSESGCRIQFNLRNNSGFSMGVRKGEQATCLLIDSNGESGWHYGNLSAKEFGKIIDSVAISNY